MKEVKPDEAIQDAGILEPLIYTIRGRRVILDTDLAALYDVTTKRLNEQVKRNPARFPDDFAFVLVRQEVTALRSQFATSKGRGGSRYLPRAFTEHGAIMAANVLNSERAVEMSVYVVRAFVKMRETLAATAELSRRLETVERRIDQHDENIRALVAAVRQLMTPPEKPRRRIGFRKGEA